MNRHRSPRMRWLLDIATTTGLVAYALGAALMAQSAPETIIIMFNHKDPRLVDVDNNFERLDDLALRMKNRPEIRVQIIGYASPDEFFPHGAVTSTAQQFAETRAYRVRAYLELRYGIDPSRLTCSAEVCSPESNDPRAIRFQCQKVVITLRQE